MKQDNVTCSVCYKLNSYSDPDTKNISWQEPIRLSITNKTPCKRDKSKLLNTILKTKLWIVEKKDRILSTSRIIFLLIGNLEKKKPHKRTTTTKLPVWCWPHASRDNILEGAQNLNLGKVKKKKKEFLETLFLWTEKNETVPFPQITIQQTAPGVSGTVGERERKNVWS